MAKWQNAQQVQDVCWQMRTADWPRDANRARINQLFNGVPPYTSDEVQANNITVNVNWLDGTRLAHDARMQMQQSMMKEGKFFVASTDAGPVSKRGKWGNSATKIVGDIMRKSLLYYEYMRNKVGAVVLHGIAPGTWEDPDRWCPDPLGVEDILMPAKTYLTFRNLPFFCILRDYTAPELIRWTRSAKVDKAWNMDLVDSSLEWIDRESMALLGSNYPDIWSPTKQQERIKSDGGIYMGDEVPTISVFDFWYWSDENGEEGWRRRVTLDDWSTPGSAGAQPGHNSKVNFGKGEWLYNPGDRVVAATREEIFSCNFADLSAVTPYRYHTVRSVGFLLYAVCHLQNRLRCKMSEAVFEALLMYFRVKSMDEAERVLKVELANRGFIDESLQFVPAAERYQVNTALVELGLQENQRIINENASSWTQSQDKSSDRTEKTKFQVMAEVQAAQALISAGLQQAYRYQESEDREIFRRFLRPNSLDHDVRVARDKMLKAGIPEKYLIPEAWEINHVQVLGAGNKTMEMAIAEQLMQFRPLYDPEPQREILRSVTLAITDSPELANRLVPEQPQVSDTIHDTEIVFGTLMTGSAVTPKSGLNRIEVAGRMLQLMEAKVQQITQTGGVGTPQDLQGLQMCAQYTSAFIQMMEQDKQEKSTARAMAQALSKVMNEVRAFAQRQQEMAQQAAQAGNGQMDPKDMAKLKAQEMQAQIKAKNTQQSHAERTAQKRLSFEQEMAQKKANAQLDLQVKAAQSGIDLKKKAADSHIDLEREKIKNRMKSTKEE
jgi:hypothetical protein